MSFVIPSIFTAVDKMSAVMSKIGSNFTSLADKATTANARMERSLHKVHERAIGVSVATGAAGLAILAPLGVAAKAAADFQDQMGNIATIVDTAKESIGDMGNKILDLAKKMPVKISDLTEAMYQIRSSGVSAADAMDVLEHSAKLSVVGLSTTTEATKAVTSALVSFKDEHMSASTIADIFFKTVQAGKTKMADINMAFGANAAIISTAGVKFREFQAATAAMTNTGMSAAEAQTALKGATIALIKPSGDMAKALHLLGVKSGNELIKKMGGLVPAMFAVGEAGKKAGLNVNKEFGRVQGLEAYTLLTGKLSQAFRDNLQAMSGANTMEEKYADKIKEANAQGQIARNVFQVMSIKLGNVLLPVLNKVIAAVIPIVERVSEWVKKHKALTEGIVIGALVVGSFLMAISGISGVIAIISGATWLWTAASWALSASLWANPITWIIIAIVLLITIIVVVVSHVKGWGAQWEATISWMGDFTHAFGLAVKLTWLKVANGFMSMVDAMVGAWYWFENKVGMISDTQYKENMAQIEAEKKARLDAIQETVTKLTELNKKVMEGPGWHMSWDDEWKPKDHTPAINPRATQQQMMQGLFLNAKSQAEITIKDQTSGSAEVTKNPGGIPIKITKTTGQFGNNLFTGH